jgi:hypothetical protein
MSTSQAVIFGMMLSWTTSLVLLAFFIWRERIGLEDAGRPNGDPAKAAEHRVLRPPGSK